MWREESISIFISTDRYCSILAPVSISGEISSKGNSQWVFDRGPRPGFFTGIVFVAEFSTQFSCQHPSRRPPLAPPDNPCVCVLRYCNEKKKGGGGGGGQLSNTDSV